MPEVSLKRTWRKLVFPTIIYSINSATMETIIAVAIPTIYNVEAARGSVSESESKRNTHPESQK